MTHTKKISLLAIMGLVVLSIFTLPAKGAPAKATSPAVLIQYKHCLDLFSDETDLYDANKSSLMQLNQFVSLVVLNCAKFKPSSLTEAKSAQYEKCLELGNWLRYDLKVSKNEDTGLWEAGSLRGAIPYIHEACKSYKP